MMDAVRQSLSHYEVLGVAPHATHEEIRRAYRSLVKRHHPDANPETPTEARAEVARIIAAWAVLGDPERRRAYDWAIGTTPRPRTAGTADDEAAIEDPEDLEDLDLAAHLQEEAAVRTRPADLLVVVPILLLLIAVGTFVYSTMTQSELLRTVAILLAPVTAGGFVAAPLFVMLRSRRRP